MPQDGESIDMMRPLLEMELLPMEMDADESERPRASHVPTCDAVTASVTPPAAVARAQIRLPPRPPLRPTVLLPWSLLVPPAPVHLLKLVSSACTSRGVEMLACIAQRRDRAPVTRYGKTAMRCTVGRAPRTELYR